MKFLDLAGNEIKEGDTLALAIGSELGAGVVQKLDTGLGITQTTQGVQGQPASVLLSILVQRQVLPNGVVLGVLKIAKPETSSLVVG